MESNGGIPWLGGPITLHAWREYTCTLPTKAECEYQEGYWRFWYEADHRYAVPTVGFFLAVILVFAIGNLASALTSRRAKASKKVSQTTALLRYLSYRTPLRVGKLDWNSAPAGVLLLAAVGVIFFFCMVLGPKPYYWPSQDYGSSPPLATRSGWLALGCLPFVFATAGKSNFITAVTDISHEKLQVFHRWIAYAFFVLSLLHTFPFIKHDIQNHMMVMNWNTSVFYWTGVVALLAQAWLTFASWGPIRNMCYEWFKFSHFVAGLVFVLFLFFHCDYTLSSWYFPPSEDSYKSLTQMRDYFIATGVLFAGSWLHRQTRIYFEHGINHRASLSLAPNGFIRVSVPTKATWRVGQHFFVRFMSLGLHAGTIHPFSACSLPERYVAGDVKESELVFFIRPRGGFTSRLAHFIESRTTPKMRVLLDGPYGGVHMQKVDECQRMLVIAGGSGAGWTLPFISAFLRKAAKASDAAEQPSIKVILATRDLATKLWYEREVRNLVTAESKSSRLALEVEVYFTGSGPVVEEPNAAGQFLQKLDDPEKAPDLMPTEKAHDSDSSSQSGSSYGFQQLGSRPDLPAVMRQEASSSASLGVFLCGPLSMQNDVSNAVAQEELRLAKTGTGQVYLHMEHFSWA